MIEATVQQQAAMQAAILLRRQLLRLGTNTLDITIQQNGNGATLTAVRSAGARSEFGDQRLPALRRVGRALEALRRGENL
jgi:hypothetical protein